MATQASITGNYTSDINILQTKTNKLLFVNVMSCYVAVCHEKLSLSRLAIWDSNSIKLQLKHGIELRPQNIMLSQLFSEILHFPDSVLQPRWILWVLRQSCPPSPVEV